LKIICTLLGLSEASAKVKSRRRGRAFEANTFTTFTLPIRPFGMLLGDEMRGDNNNHAKK
jgi:hypothetical protein